LKDTSKYMKILVTGATGFIGGRLVRRLKKLGHDIVCLARQESDISILEEMGLPLVFGNIKDGRQINEIFLRERPEIVFHCAARVRDENDDSLQETNVYGTRNICSACFAGGVKRLVYLSSVAVISGNRDVPLFEDLPYSATAVYGRSKIEAEKIALEYREKGLAVCVIRPCMVYGEGEPHAMDRILDLVNRRLLPIPVLSGMKDKLRLVYVDNVVQALELAMKKDEALLGTFFVADREVITIRRFVEIVSDELGKGKPLAIPEWLIKLGLLLPPIKKRFDRIFKDRVYDITRAVEILGYDPAISTEEGLRRTVRAWRIARGNGQQSYQPSAFSCQLKRVKSQNARRKTYDGE